MLVVLDVREQQGGPVAIAKGTPRDGAKFAVPVYFGANLMKLAFPPQMRDPPTQITKLHVVLPTPYGALHAPNITSIYIRSEMSVRSTIRSSGDLSPSPEGRG